MRLADLELLMHTADLGSLSAAAKLLDWSPAAASAAVKRLETQWGVPIFVRSTRSLRVSAQGALLMPHVRQAMQALAAAKETAANHHLLRGELQISMPSDLGRNVLLPHLDRFQEQHPSLTMLLHFTDSPSDLRRTSVDAAIRYGTPADSTLVALALAPHNQRILVASPSYLAKHGMPKHAEDLKQHEALRFMLSGALPKTWALKIDAQWRNLAIQGMRSSNDGEVVKRWAIKGMGIAYKSRLDVAAELEDGVLQHVRPDWDGEPSPLYLVVPGRHHLTPAIQALRSWLQQCFQVQQVS
ncbi:MAG: LysR family transcriptional regulator [Brachymonas sp.]